jgi:hypothetical protein
MWGKLAVFVFWLWICWLCGILFFTLVKAAATGPATAFSSAAWINPLGFSHSLLVERDIFILIEVWLSPSVLLEISDLERVTYLCR